MSGNVFSSFSPESRELLLLCGELAAARGDVAFLVGGSVRDAILGRPHDDLDVVVEGDGLALAQALSRAINGDLTRHHAFQTATVSTEEGLRIDVATARKEIYPRPGQLPQVIPGSLDDDLRRRDFTINTLAIALDRGSSGELIDPLRGRDDLQEGTIRVMHSRSFADDPTRVLRALRFALRFGYSLDADTRVWLAEAVEGGYLADVSAHRVRKELALAFAEAPVEGPLLLRASGVLSCVHEGLEADEQSLLALQDLQSWYEDIDVPEAVSSRDAPSWSVVLAACGAALSPQARWGVVRRLALSREERRPLIEAGAPWDDAEAALQAKATRNRPGNSVVEQALRHLSPGTMLVSVSQTGRDHPFLEDVVRSYLSELATIRTELDGDDLKALGVPMGPTVGKYLERLLAARLDQEVVDLAGERRLVDGWLAEESR